MQRKSTVSSEKKVEELIVGSLLGIQKIELLRMVQLKSFEKLNEFSFRLKKDTLDNGVKE